MDEIARLLKVSKGTVRRWLKTGLEPIEGKGMTIVRGAELREFLQLRRANAKCPCGPGYLYCLRCRTRKEPTNGKADVLYIDRGAGKPPTTGNLRGVCPDCGTLMYRRVNLARLGSVRGNLTITLPEAPSRLRGNSSPSPE